MAQLPKLAAEDIIGAIVNFGGDPSAVDSLDFAEDVLQSIENATSYREVTDSEEFENAKDSLDLTDYQVGVIWSFVDGSEFLVCLPNDWHIK